MLTEEIVSPLLPPLFFFYGKYALYCHSPKLNPDSDFMGMIMFSKFKTNLSYLQFWLLLEALEVLSWMEETHQLFNKMFG
ncbi:unnamed protein product, partial [Vitis vinifera]|uniref:Uncharacterized protein n=1 Tax=Vitis vinifera TaxID=29760 RepID=D7T5L8_VITVI